MPSNFTSQANNLNDTNQSDSESDEEGFVDNRVCTKIKENKNFICVVASKMNDGAATEGSGVLVQGEMVIFVLTAAHWYSS